MPKSSKLRAIVRSNIDRFLPDFAFFAVSRALYTLANKDRYGANIQFQRIGRGLYRASDKFGVEVYFCERTRFELYHFWNGVNRRIVKIFEKYSFGPVVVSSGDTVIDIGANIGEFSVAVAKKAKVVLAIDPDPQVQQALQLNVQNYENIHRIQVALSDADGDANFFISTKDADSSLVRPEKFTDVIKVRACRLDSLLKEQSVETVDFLKLEAEGWEPEILLGAPHTLSITSKIAVDAGPEREGMPTVDAVKEILSRSGFEVYEREFMVFGLRKE